MTFIIRISRKFEENKTNKRNVSREVLGKRFGSFLEEKMFHENIGNFVVKLLCWRTDGEPLLGS